METISYIFKLFLATNVYVDIIQNHQFIYLKIQKRNLPATIGTIAYILLKKIKLTPNLFIIPALASF